MKRKPQDVKYRITAQADGDELEIFIFDEISSFFGVSAEKISETLAEHSTAKVITVHVNSPGGNALDGVAIYNALVRHSARVDVIVEGMALSAASLIAMSGDSIAMAAGSQMMVHEARGMMGGTAADMVKFADLLKATSGQMAQIYSARSGRELKTVLAEMKRETFMTADEAVEMGYATEVLEAKAMAAHFDLDSMGFEHVPDAVRELASAAAPTLDINGRPLRGLSDAVPTLKTSPTPEAGDDNGAMVAPTPIAVMAGLRSLSLVSDFGKGRTK